MTIMKRKMMMTIMRMTITVASQNHVSEVMCLNQLTLRYIIYRVY